VLHHTAQVELLAVVERVHIDLDRVIKEPVDQDGGVRADQRRVLDVAAQCIVVVDDLHAASPQHVTGPDQNRIADLVGDPVGLLIALGHAMLR